MFGRFIYLREDRKFFILASVVCALVILVVISVALGHSEYSLGYSDLSQLAMGQ